MSQYVFSRRKNAHAYMHTCTDISEVDLARALSLDLFRGLLISADGRAPEFTGETVEVELSRWRSKSRRDLCLPPQLRWTQIFSFSCLFFSF